MSTTYAQRQTTARKKDAPAAASVLDASSQSESLQRKADMANNAAQREEAPRPNNTGMPDNLKAGIESLSGFSMDDVRVHYNSSKPATVQALAYTQGTDIHVAPGQEKHLPHEAWHVAQQMAGRVSPTTNINGMPVNDNAALEHEADVMGEMAVQCKSKNAIQLKEINQSVVQRHRWAFYYKEVNKVNEVENLTYLGPDLEEEELPSPLDSTKLRFLDLENLQNFLSRKKNSPGIYVIQWKDGERATVCPQFDIEKYLKESVNIGTEFTFRKKGEKVSDWPKLMLPRPSIPFEDYSSVSTYATSIEAFVAEMKEFCKNEGVEPEESKALDGDKCNLVEGVEGKRLTVQLPRSKFFFTVTISVDDNCIELQTTPISYAIYTSDIKFIEGLIFGSAKKANLEAATDKTDDDGKIVQYGGGGHISLDSQSAFVGGVEVLHKFIELYTNCAKEQKGKVGKVFSYNDDVNSPLMNIDALNNFFALQGKNIGNITDIEEYLNLLKTFYTDVAVASHELKDDKRLEKTGDISHYQAVNVDDFLDKPDEKGRIKKGRIEMRNLDAQTSIGQLLEQVQALYYILVRAYY